MPLTLPSPAVRSLSEASYFSPSSTERSHQLRGFGIILRSTVTFDLAKSSSGKQPKFSGKDALDLMLKTELVENEKQGEEVLRALEDERYIEASKGTIKSPEAKRKRFRFTEALVSEAATVSGAGNFLLGVIITGYASTKPKDERRDEGGKEVDEQDMTRIERARSLSESEAPPPGGLTGAVLPKIVPKEDTGVPKIAIKDVQGKIEEILGPMKTEYRWIEAGRCLLGCKNAVASAGPNHPVSKSVQSILDGEEMKDIRKRYKKALEGLGLLDSNEGWKFFKQNGSGTKVYSKYDEKGNLWIKVDGIFRGTPTSCASVWKEGDLFKCWFPFCSYSDIFHKESDAEIVFRYGGTNPVGRSETVLHGWGVNHLVEGIFLILGGSVKDWKGKAFPKPGFMVSRNWVHCLSILVEPLGANMEGEHEVRNVMICSLDLPKLPQWFLEWILGKVFIGLVDAMSTCGKKACEEGSQTEHARRTREDPFYKEFLTPLFIKFMDGRGLKH
ncbi:hypothetical protein TrCOL_g7156 [Triparma columacea]|uniref:Uncharacterized protein n=1 Tax=Triparma columacea TaxID=722753 RepID=A0A9W7GKN9_9STRA|nr:hypothetical protein TrCOL_g7156 [Triparma columacea]